MNGELIIWRLVINNSGLLIQWGGGQTTYNRDLGSGWGKCRYIFYWGANFPLAFVGYPRVACVAASGWEFAASFNCVCATSPSKIDIGVCRDNNANDGGNPWVNYIVIGGW